MSYISTIISVLILVAVLFLAIRYIIRSKKQGGCVGCPHSSCCSSRNSESCCCGGCHDEN